MGGAFEAGADLWLAVGDGCAALLDAAGELEGGMDTADSLVATTLALAGLEVAGLDATLDSGMNEVFAGSGPSDLLHPVTKTTSAAATAPAVVIPTANFSSLTLLDARCTC